MSESRRNFVVWVICYPSGMVARIGNRPAAFLTRREARKYVAEVEFGSVRMFALVTP